MKLSWFRRSKIIVEVLDDEILVTMPGTRFSVLYEKTKNNRLITSSFSGRKGQWRKKHGELPTLSFTCLDSGKREGEGDRLASLGAG
jgi:hypothetical protein